MHPGPALLGIVLVALVISGLEPADRATWILEVGPVLIGAPLLVAAWRRAPPSRKGTARRKLDR